MRTVLLAAALAVLSGCGSAQDARVQTAAGAFAQSLRDEDGSSACAALAPLTRDELESSEQAPCARALVEQDLPLPARLGQVRLFGRQASVVVHSDDGATDTWFLSRFGDRWLVVAAGCVPRGEQLPFACEVEGA